jgi:HEAT repeat protein
MSAWALGYQQDPSTAAYVAQLLRESPSQWVASEAILAMGRQRRRESVTDLAEILHASDRAKGLPSWRWLAEQQQRKLDLVDAQRQVVADRARAVQNYKDWMDAHPEFRKNNPNHKPATYLPAGGAGANEAVRVVMGYEEIQWNGLRASAAIALGQYDDPRATKTLLRALTHDDTRYSDVYKSFAIMSLSRSADRAVTESLGQILSAKTPRNRNKGEDDHESPLRGFAGVALGLYARPRETAQGPVDPPKALEVCRMLAERVADTKETEEVRAACALALGLSARDESVKLLQAASKTIGDDQPILIGYTLLGRAMLADQTILQPAKAFLAPAHDGYDTASILGRRAAVLSLGVLGSEEGIPILIDAWSLNYYANREVALAFALLEALSAADPLIKLIEQYPDDQSYPAMCLGELFSKRRPHRVARFLNGQNYTIRNDKMIPFEAISNEFLMNYLVASFGETWK